jgi:ABC-type sugar transport system ATPase subunit
MAEPLSETALEMNDISMRFGDVWVLNDVDLKLPPGAIHAIVGHNGAGKSTLMKIALGVYRPTRGEVRIGGRRLTYNRPAAARELGLGMVFQERSLIPTLNGLDNLFLNSEHLNRFRVVQRAPEVEEAAALLEQLDVPRSLLDLRVSEMSTIEQELLEIAKALRLSNKVLVLDEPTAPLGRAEIHRLFEFVRTVARRGTGIVLITHHLAEVFAISDHVTCLREGRVVLSAPTKDTSMTELIRAMLGHTSVAPAQEKSTETTEIEGDRSQLPTRLAVTHLQVGEKLLDVTFDIARGEIVGVAGVVGSGRSTLLRTLFGDVRPTGGVMTLDGKPYRQSNPQAAISGGVYLIPEDRALFGIILTKSINENTVLPILSRFVNKLRLLEMSEGRSLSREMMTRLDIRARNIDQVVGELSGGNQQKVVLAKALAVGARLMLLDEPTFGVDIGAVKEIVRQVRQMAQGGAAVLWATSDIREMLEVADRVIILRDGVIDRSIDRGEPEFTEDFVFARMQRITYAQTAVLVEARDAKR